jgi:aminopeptidase
VDERVEAYARLLVDRSVAPAPGAQVLVVANVPARPLVEAVAGALARRGCYALVRLEYGDWRIPVSLAWAREAPDELLGEMAPIERYASDHDDARIVIHAPENTRESSDLDPARLAVVRRGLAPYLRRSQSLELEWVSCQFPTPALAQDAGMSLAAFEDFLYGACLLDWDAERRRMERIAARFEDAREVRIEGHDTDLTLSLAGRQGWVDDGHLNLPGGEVFFAPVEDSAAGEIAYSEFPAVYASHEVAGVRLRFEAGRIVDASASSGEDFLLETLDADEGARRLGELGIGCNPGITRHMKNVLFDEKIDGTVHLAVGYSYPFTGGANKSSVHWDMVKDLRPGGRLSVDGEVVQESGRWLF